MTNEKLDQFTRGREAYCTTDQTLWNVSHVDPMFEIIYLNHSHSQDLREVPYAVFMKNYYFTDELVWGPSTKHLQCECGVDKLGYGKHSDYCPKHRGDN